MKYLRVIYQSAEWSDLVAEGWRTICINTEGIALMVRRSA